MLILTISFLNFIFTSETNDLPFDIKDKVPICTNKSIFVTDGAPIQKSVFLWGSHKCGFVWFCKVETFEINCYRCKKTLKNKPFKVLNHYPDELLINEGELYCHECLCNIQYKNYIWSSELLYYTFICKNRLLLLPKWFVDKPYILNIIFLFNNGKYYKILLYFNYFIDKNYEIFLIYQDCANIVTLSDIEKGYTKVKGKKVLPLIVKLQSAVLIDILKKKGGEERLVFNSNSKITKRCIEKVTKYYENIKNIRVLIKIPRYKIYRCMDVINLNIDKKKILKILKKMTEKKMFKNLILRFVMDDTLVIMYKIEDIFSDLYTVYVQISSDLIDKCEQTAAFVASNMLLIIIIENEQNISHMKKKNFDIFSLSYYFSNQTNIYKIKYYYGSFNEFGEVGPNCYKHILIQFNINSNKIMSFVLYLYKSLYHTTSL